jgi:hypothetical protein
LAKAFVRAADLHIGKLGEDPRVDAMDTVKRPVGQLLVNLPRRVAPPFGPGPRRKDLPCSGKGKRLHRIDDFLANSLVFLRKDRESHRSLSSWLVRCRSECCARDNLAQAYISGNRIPFWRIADTRFA